MFVHILCKSREADINKDVKLNGQFPKFEWKMFDDCLLLLLVCSQSIPKKYELVSAVTKFVQKSSDIRSET